MYKKNYTPQPSAIHTRYTSLVQHSKINITYHINRLKRKNHMSISIYAKNLDKIQHPFLKKTLNELEIKRNFFNWIKSIYKKATVNIIILKVTNFPTKIRCKAKMAPPIRILKVKKSEKKKNPAFFSQRTRYSI